MRPQIPPLLAELITSISQDELVSSIWLIGSRANGYAKPDSDWDILYFSSREPYPRDSRLNSIDVIHVGPNDTFLLEGMSLDFHFSFSNWHWHQYSDHLASYTSPNIDKSLTFGKAYDTSYNTSQSRSAFKLWPC